MTILKKQYIVVYDNDNNILSKSDSNIETYVGKGKHSAEFDTLEELGRFIKDKGLKEDI